MKLVKLGNNTVTGLHKKKFPFEFVIGSILSAQSTQYKADKIAQAKSIAGFLS